ncbi:MAG: N-acetylmuramoyl-L-alanine amidase [Gammaproteobacteria bacterium]|jgi:N-acetylmuramoyl-L-alanine amidase
MKRIVALLLVMLSVPALASVKVREVHYTVAPETSRLVLNLSKSPDYKVFTLPHPARVVIDLKNARLRSALPNVHVNGSPVQAVRSGIRHGRDLRLVLVVKSKVVTKSFILQPSAAVRGYRLVVDLQRVGVTRVAAAAVPQPAPPVARTAAAAPGPHSASGRTRTVIAANAPSKTKLRDVVVAIDAGHGGIDPGAHGPHGVKEKNVTLAIARQLDKQLSAEPGIKPVLTRDGDYFVPLRKRVIKARKAKADLFISIHADAIDDRSVKGSSVYVLSESGASSEAARWLAEKENAADLVGGVSLDDKDDVLKSVLLDLSQTATIEASDRAGSEVLHELGTVGKLHRHRIEHAGFVVLKAPDIPSMLVETAFISNPQQERKLTSPVYQRRLARAIAQGVQEYFRENAPPGTKIAQANSTRKYTISKGDTLSTIANHYGVSVHTLRVSNNLSSDRLYVGTVLRIPPSDGT